MAFKQQKLSIRTIFGLKGWKLELPVGSFLYTQNSGGLPILLEGWILELPVGSFLYTQKSGGQSFLLEGWRLKSSADGSHCTWDVLEGLK
ncbi:hypothetical protein ODU13_02905 [Streptococcus suis]